MKILHLAPHLGGGVGKAHAALSAALPDDVQQTFALLEPPRDARHVAALEAAGARVVVADSHDHVAALAREADIVQVEFWNHPRLFECLARCDFPPMRSVFWSHISGLFRPLVPPGLIEQAGRFVFTSEASLAIPWVQALRRAGKAKVSVVNSGFGFADIPGRTPVRGRQPVIAYLGTVDFIKMHPVFFDAVDQLVGSDIRVSVWGAADQTVVDYAKAMRHPERICCHGETADPVTALAQADIFFYPLQPDHYGTAENALTEAMSLGLVPVVMNNPAERGIVRDSDTGFVAQSLAECVSVLQTLLLVPELRERIAGNAARHAAENFTPARSALEFMIVWLGLLAEPKQRSDFRAAIGDSPADWYLATQCLPNAAWVPPAGPAGERAAKGTLAHFESVFAGDDSLPRLRRAPSVAAPKRKSKPERLRA